MNNLYYRNIVKFIIKWLSDIDKTTLLIGLSLVFIGITMVDSAGYASAKRINATSNHFIVKHIVFVVIGLSIAILLSMFRKNAVLNMSYILFGVFLFALMLTPILGTAVKGSKRWINLGMSIQASELLKPFFIVLNGKLLTMSKGKTFCLFASVFLLFTVDALCIIEPDFGATIMYTAVWGVQAFISGTSVNFLTLSLPFAFIIFIIGFIAFPHFRYRIMLFFSETKGNEQYQIKKSLESIYNGGYFGQGLGEGRVKYQLPDAHTDYIFSAIYEELGLIMSAGILFLYLILIVRQFMKYQSRHQNAMYSSIVFGFGILIGLHALGNIAVSTDTIPSKGMILPFLSYGGSSLLSNLILFGMLLCFTRRKYNFISPYTSLCKNKVKK